MTIRFRTARRLALVIRLLATLSATLLATPIIILLLVLWLFPGLDFSVSDIFCGLRRFFIGLYSGHGLRPITLREVSAGTVKSTKPRP